MKKKSKSDLYTNLNGSNLKPKLNFNITSMKQKSVNLRTEGSETGRNERDMSIGKKLENYKIKKLEQKLRESGNT